MLNAVNQHMNKIRMDARNNILGYSSRGLTTDDPQTYEIADYIELETARFDGFSIVGGIYVDLSKVPAAVAYEYGSGLQGSEGTEYPIETVEHPEMVFEWFPPKFANPNLPWKIMYDEDGSGGIVGFDDTWRLMHPGVEEKRFMRDALESNRSIVVQGLGKLGVIGISSFFRDKYGQTIEIR